MEIYLRISDKTEKYYKGKEVEYGQSRDCKFRTFKILRSNLDTELYVGSTYYVRGEHKRSLSGNSIVPENISDATPRGTMVDDEEMYAIDMARMSGSSMSKSNVW